MNALNTTESTHGQAEPLELLPLDSAAPVEEIRRLFENNGFPRTAAYNNHIYRMRNGRAAVACFYQHEGKLGGMYAAVPCELQIDRQQVHGFQSLDTMVDTACRGRGVFQKTALAHYAHLESESYPVVYGFPNGNSFKGFQKYLGWVFLDPVPFLVRPIRVSYFLKNRFLKALARHVKVPAFGASRQVEFSQTLPAQARLHTLCEGFASTFRVGVARTPAFLKDRYTEVPHKQYQFATVSDAAGLQGLCVFCMEDKHGGKIGYVMELVYNPACPKVRDTLLKAVVRRFSESGCDCALAWCFSHHSSYAGYLKNLFFPLPEKLRPIELHFGFRCFNPTYLPVLSDRKNWYVSYSDSDTV
ncbi:MAG: GNAT family N-acetyltransferase [Limnobacter sp.]|nr:GNAT family N-acetyltransferase [Limnobacter sp.]